MTLTDADAGMAVVLAVVLTVLVATGLLGWYHYGYFEGKVEAYRECPTSCVPAPK